MAETIHTFTKGMDLDTEKALRPNDVAYTVENFRLISNTDGTTGAYMNVKGNTIYRTFDGSLFDGIAGYCVVRNYLILFVTRFFPQVSKIYRITLDDNDVDTKEEPKLIYDDSKNNDQGDLHFTSNLKAVGRYESEDIIKIYWTDGLNPVRFINIAVENTTDGLEYNGTTNYYAPADRLEFLPNHLIGEFSSIEVIKGGTLLAGVVQYTYQFYNKYGAATTFAPLSNPTHLVQSSDTASSATKYEGSDIGTNTGKSVKLDIIHYLANVGFDSMKVVRVHYDTYGGIPTVSLVADVGIEKVFTAPYKVYSVVDTGNSIYEYTSEEIAVLGRTLFSARDIATKDDLLLFANIEEDFYDVDFDARAFRFVNSSTTFHIYNDGAIEPYTLTADTNAGWDTILDDIGEDNDCINLFNDLTNDQNSGDAYKCRYQYNSTTFGGNGRNVKYKFTTDDFILDNKANHTKSGANTTVRVLDAPQAGSITNYSFTNYASPYMSMAYKGYQRGEIYRFGIVFFDVRGRASKVKWIGDIRFPSFKDTGYDKLAEYDSGNLDSSILGIEFYVRNVPTDAVAWSIVRMPRTNADKTVISQGVLSCTVNTGGIQRYAPYFPMTGTTGDTYGTSARTMDDDLLIYMSPDINYGELDYKNGDYFETLGYYSDYGTYATETGNVKENVLKYSDFILLTSTSYITPDVFKYIEVTGTDDIVSLGGKDFHNVVTHTTGELNSVLGKCTVFTYTGNFVKTGAAASLYHSPTVVNLRRINNSQYGGNTYENRFGQAYINCGQVVNTGSGSFTRGTSYVTKNTVRGGDIFIVMYERLHGMYYSTAKSIRVAYIPLESKYNLSINNGTTYSRNVGVDDDIYLIRENAGTHSDADTPTANYIVQDKDFYVYNTVYSQNDSIVKYFSANTIDNEIVDYDTRIVVSEKKINNEIIDNWTRFLANNFIDVDTTYGYVSNIINWKNKIFYLQETGFGLLSINERALITGSTSASPLVLGTGGVLDRYDYISTYYGNTNLRGALSTESGIYWIDNFKNDLVLYNGQSILPLSKSRRVDTYFKGIKGRIATVNVAYNTNYNEAWFSITSNSIDDPVILVFSELLDCFSAFYTNPADFFIQLRSKIITWEELPTIGIDERSLYEEDAGEFNTFFGVFYPSKLYIKHTEGYPYIKVYDNVEYSSVSKDDNGVNQFEDTFNLVQVYNDFQNTGEITLTKGTNLQRRERLWTFAIPRNAMNKNVSENEDIHDIFNLDATQTFKERIRDGYAVLRLDYNNTNEFSIPYIKIKYRISHR